VSDYFRKLVREARDLYAETEARFPDNRSLHTRSLFNDALMSIREAEQLVECENDKQLHFAFKRALADARKALLMVAAEPRLRRDAKRQAATRKKRGPRWPELDDDIRAVLERKPKASAKDIWDQLPDFYGNRTYYVNSDGDKIVSDSGRQLKFGGFRKRVSKIKKPR
jgi:hypothetical protein